MGVFLGEAGPGQITFDDAELAHALGFAALAIILAEGGLTTSWRDIRPSMPTRTLPGHGRRRGLGVGDGGRRALRARPAVGAGRAARVPSPRRPTRPRSSRCCGSCPLPKRLSGALEAESGLNDAPTVVLVTLISTGALRRARHRSAPPRSWSTSWSVGVAIGLAVGFAGAWLMRRAALPSSGLYPIAVLTLTFLAYGAAAFVHASGFAAVYVAALVLGNSELPHRGATRSFAEGVAWLAQIGLFVMLGLLLSPERISWHTTGVALVAGLILTVRRAAGVGRGQLPGPADALAGPDLPVLGRSARRGADRADDHPARRGGDGRAGALRRRVRDGRRLHVAHRADPADGGPLARRRPAQRAARARARGGTARADRRRPAPGHDQRRRRGCTASRSASCGCRSVPPSRC